jgi:putative intracellular protease/amidase
VDAGAFVLRAPWGLDALDTADTIILPGIAEPADDVPEEVLSRLQAAAGRGTRIASICAGAFVLAATGLPARTPTARPGEGPYSTGAKGWRRIVRSLSGATRRASLR